MRTRKAVPVHNLKVSRRGKVKKRSVLWRWRRALYVCTLTMVVGVAGLIWIVGQVDLPVDPRKAPTEAQTTFLCSDEVAVNCNAANALAQLHGKEDRVLVTYRQIPAVLRQAVIATEDKDFFKHGGVDPVGIARAALSDIRGQGVTQGGSTITQQYVKEEYLNSEQTITRKVKEASLAIKLEQKISKKEILTRYLNTVYFGRGAYGVQAASRTWFGHDVEALNAGEAAFLAGLLRFPNGADPYRGPASLKEAIRRRKVGLVRMRQEGYLTVAQATAFGAVPMDPKAVTTAPAFVLAPPKASVLGQNVRGKEWGSEYFVEYVRQWLVKEFGSSAVLKGGLKVYTTLDLGMQKDAHDAIASTLDRNGDPSAAMVALDDQGQVKAMYGGNNFERDKFNLATSQGSRGRQPGSTFKPFALAEAIREGYSIQSVLPSPTKIELPDPDCRNSDGTPWSVKGGPGGSSSLVTATKNSINSVYAQLMARLGPAKVIDMANQLGVQADIPKVCSVVLGAGEVSVLDMAHAYSTFANNGLRKDPIVVTRVEKPDGSVIRFDPVTKQVLTPDQAGRVTYSLQQVIAGGTGSAADFGRQAAGKTGTTQQNADSWFVGYTPKLTAAVWMGYPKGLIPMTDVHGVKVQGGNFPAEMWKKFMEAATAGFDTGTFPQLDSSVLSEGQPLDTKYGRTSMIGRGENQTTTTTKSRSGSRGSTSTTTGTRSGATSTTKPRTTTPQTTAPKATTPKPTVPPATRPPVTTTPPKPKPTTPPVTRPAAAAAGG